MSQLAELKRLLIGEAAEKVEILKQRVEGIPSRTKDVSSVLPEAIEECLDERPEPFNEAIGRSLPYSIKKTIENDPDEFAAIFYPALAPSIRMMIANAMRTFSSSMNQTLESATTLKGLGWRLESMRTGIPYGEIAMRKNLEYRVEQVFLISKDSGLLIGSAINENVHGLDSDAVSGMLTAIQSFVRESFNAADDEELTNMVVGDQIVWMVHGADTVMACVIRGESPAALRDQLINVLDRINKRYREPLLSFDGSEEIEGVSGELESCLQLKLKDYDGDRKKTSWGSLLLISALVFGLLYWLVMSYERNRKSNEMNRLLATTPGVLATNLFWDDGKLKVAGLMDPLAELPWAEIEESGIEQGEVVLLMKQYSSLELEIFAKRLRRELAIPEEISIDVTDAFDKKFAVLKGASDFLVVNQLKNRLSKLVREDLTFDYSEVTLSNDGFSAYVQDEIGLPDGVSLDLDDDALIVKGVPSVDWHQSLTALMTEQSQKRKVIARDLSRHLVNEIKAEQFNFSTKFELEKDSNLNLQKTAKTISQLIKVAKSNNEPLKIKVTGYSNGDSTLLVNQKYQARRAQAIIDQLSQYGIDSKILQVSPNTNIYADSKRMAKLEPILAPIKQ